jgi:hypothetical protein
MNAPTSTITHPATVTGAGLHEVARLAVVLALEEADVVPTVADRDRYMAIAHLELALTVKRIVTAIARAAKRDAAPTEQMLQKAIDIPRTRGRRSS